MVRGCALRELNSTVVPAMYCKSGPGANAQLLHRAFHVCPAARQHQIADGAGGRGAFMRIGDGGVEGDAPNGVKIESYFLYFPRGIRVSFPLN